ncbi:hypothetical protein EYW49_06635 [Siculibacillus lacustris]|uniref:Uncharacterized protein n=1 Tax=Siculibacillus lacustris TaxID=1549641 RepID=A0A4Q9VTW2_9HYPH|nr:hypothetical protein [Siculibacillus lacustris]TBW39539.1 hypothetical protein EYW49_06635 [Siculibacillus lacustris]
MTPLPELVEFAHTQFLGRGLAAEEVDGIVALLGSRAELLAALILREGALDGEPALADRLAEIARRGHTAASTPRRRRGDAVGARERARAVADALAAVLAAEAEHARLTNTLHDAMTRLTGDRDEQGASLGYHWFVGRESDR